MPEEKMIIFTRTYDMLTWLLPLSESFPRSQRFAVTQRLQHAALNFQETIIEANALRGAMRAQKLRVADTELRKLRLYLRLCEKWKWITSGQYHHVSKMLVEIGKLLGGWLKTVTPAAQASL